MLNFSLRRGTGELAAAVTEHRLLAEYLQEISRIGVKGDERDRDR